VASIRAGKVRKARKKYVPSPEQRADDERLRKDLANADMKKFDAIFRKADWASGAAKKT
jgi:hypothetical protein